MLLPVALRGVAILLGKPGQMVLPGKGLRKACGLMRQFSLVKARQLAHQHRHGPAIQDQMVIGDHDDKLLLSKVPDAQTDERSALQVERGKKILCLDRGESFVPCADECNDLVVACRLAEDDTKPGPDIGGCTHQA